MLLKESVVIQSNKDYIGEMEKRLPEDILTTSLLGIIIWWIKNGIQFSSEYIAAQIIELYQ